MIEEEGETHVRIPHTSVAPKLTIFTPQQTKRTKFDLFSISDYLTIKLVQDYNYEPDLVQRLIKNYAENWHYAFSIEKAVDMLNKNEANKW